MRPEKWGQPVKSCHKRTVVFDRNVEASLMKQRHKKTRGSSFYNVIFLKSEGEHHRLYTTTLKRR